MYIHTAHLLTLPLTVPVEDCTISLFGATTISEDATFVSICVQLDGTTSGDVSVTYNTVPLTATGTKLLLNFTFVMT